MTVRKLYRPKKGRMIGGVCLALANYIGMDVRIMRIIWVILLIPGGLPGFFPYIIFWILIPSEDAL